MNLNTFKPVYNGPVLNAVYLVSVFVIRVTTIKQLQPPCNSTMFVVLCYFYAVLYYII